MGKQNEITKPSDVFDKQGRIMQRGWARKPILNYNYENIKAPWIRLKEWSHYSVLDQEQGFGIQITIGEIGYITLMGFGYLDFKNKKAIMGGSIAPLTRHKNKQPRNAFDEADIWFPAKTFKCLIRQKKDKHILSVNYPRFAFKGMKGTVTLSTEPDHDHTVVMTGYGKASHCFYYNHKINYMPSEGQITIGKGKKKIDLNFNPETSFGLLDWGRGIWPYDTHWYWGSACGKVNGVPCAFNIGYADGQDLSTHTENIFFYDGKAHKLDEIKFHHNNRDPTSPWIFTSNDNRFRMVLKPLIPNRVAVHTGLIRIDPSSLHGLYSGYVILDNGEKIEIENMLGHAEDIIWRW